MTKAATQPVLTGAKAWSQDVVIEPRAHSRLVPRGFPREDRPCITWRPASRRPSTSSWRFPGIRPSDVNQGPSRVCGRNRNNRSGGSSLSRLIDGIMGVSPCLLMPWLPCSCSPRTLFLSVRHSGRNGCSSRWSDCQPWPSTAGADDGPGGSGRSHRRQRRV